MDLPHCRQTPYHLSHQGSPGMGSNRNSSLHLRMPLPLGSMEAVSHRMKLWSDFSNHIILTGLKFPAVVLKCHMYAHFQGWIQHSLKEDRQAAGMRLRFWPVPVKILGIQESSRSCTLSGIQKYRWGWQDHCSQRAAPRLLQILVSRSLPERRLWSMVCMEQEEKARVCTQGLGIRTRRIWVRLSCQSTLPQSSSDVRP